MTTDKATRYAFRAAEDAVSRILSEVFADAVDEDGDVIITDSDTLDDIIEIFDIIDRMEARHIAAIKRRHGATI